MTYWWLPTVSFFYWIRFQVPFTQILFGRPNSKMVPRIPTLWCIHLYNYPHVGGSRTCEYVGISLPLWCYVILPCCGEAMWQGTAGSLQELRMALVDRQLLHRQKLHSYNHKTLNSPSNKGAWKKTFNPRWEPSPRLLRHPRRKPNRSLLRLLTHRTVS